ncbi:pyridoxamine 5'-phosphate oxidase family protein [Streptomyces sp. NBC_01465]|uniref:pyridoxamine 5'-phosphate oxidase family protein n=1 Tax=Streptomyces sp. NBC_01465 TaxID=2903878 RepID=UPI002E35C1A1|nr:pyridoxamine 5'-phosphate oxidase family protein [Streptomyces sp. NBC_01465]
MIPTTELDPRYSDEKAAPTPWPEALARLAAAELYWLTTVRPDGRPHVTPLIAVWLDGALHFCTGVEERKTVHLTGNPHCVLTTGSNALGEGLDLVVEGAATVLGDDAELRRLAAAYVDKYGDAWTFDVRDGTFFNQENRCVVYRVAPTTAFGFGKGTYSQTRWTFDR